MAASCVWLVNKRDNRAHRTPLRGNIVERQTGADAQWHVVVLIVWAIFRARIGIAAVLHSVSEFVEGLGRQRGLQRSGPNVVAQAERIRPANIRDGQSPFPRLPVMPVVPGKSHLLLRRDVVI